MGPTSFSQNNMFQECERWWYNSYIRKIPTITDWSYANAGKVVHTVIETFYNGEKDKTVLRKLFDKEWYGFGLHNSHLKLRADAYYLMCINAFNLGLSFTSMELKIFYPDVIAYLDGVNTNDGGLIVDWKSSTRSPENEKQYSMQGKFYAMLYHRKFGTIPKKVTIYYLKYEGSKGELSFAPTSEDLIEIEDWHHDIRKRMDKYVSENKLPPKCEGECAFFCPYKNLCSDDETILKYTIHIQNSHFQLEGPMTDLLNKGIDRKFSYELKNAFFIKKANPSANTTVKFWSFKKRTLPIGFIDGLTKTLTDYASFKNKEIAIDIQDHREPYKKTLEMPEKLIGKELRDYQEDAVRSFLRKRVGMLELGTGAGKSLIMSELIRQIGTKTLILVNRKELLKQLKDTIEETLGIEVGVIGMGESDIKDVTISTIQTISKKLKEYREYLSSVQFVVMDECHNVNNMSWWRTAGYLTNTVYRLGLTGTPYRTDGNDMFLEAINGKICYSLPAEKLIEQGWLMKPIISFVKNYMTKDDIRKQETKLKTGLINETETYNDVYQSFIVHNEKRNNFIKKLVEENKGKKTLLLVKLIEHGDMLSEMLGVPYLNGSTPKEKRNQMMEDFRNNEDGVLIGTISIFGEGLDFPSLHTIINCSGNKSDIRSVQTLGRILRKHEGKDSCIFYDFIDESRHMRLASYSRLKAFRGEGHDIDYVVL